MYLFADKITSLTAARYFAARGANWLFFDRAQLSLPQIMAIREWVEGPQSGLYFPLGVQEEDLPVIDHLVPDAVVIGHFGERSELPDNQVLIKEWRIELGDTSQRVLDRMASWPDFHFHLLRCEERTESEIRDILDALPDAILSRVVLSLHPAQVHPIPGIGGICLMAPDEQVVGLLSFDEIDEAIDRIEELIHPV
ncbi:MAG: hypothetical protein IPJ06_19225 [Saprospiraceae bacterium]|nr:hypothetical protein [Saprospiraceae bacterium]